YVDADSGKRSDAAHHYIYCQEGNKNLQVLARHRVNRLIIQSGIGSKGVLSKCNIEQLVDLPGVGENYNDHNIVFPPYLTTDKVETLTDIFQGTEEDMEPHLTQWLADGKGIMVSKYALFSMQKTETDANTVDSGIDAGIKMRPNAEDLAELGESFTPLWNDFFVNNPDKPVMWMGLISGYLGADKSVKKAFCMGYYTEYPKAIGH
ncbi:hypothetical protein MPER_09620, partial [Moniliophthora perniciosa FA553]